MEDGQKQVKSGDSSTRKLSWDCKVFFYGSVAQIKQCTLPVAILYSHSTVKTRVNCQGKHQTDKSNSVWRIQKMKCNKAYFTYMIKSEFDTFIYFTFILCILWLKCCFSTLTGKVSHSSGHKIPLINIFFFFALETVNCYDMYNN